MKFTINDAVYPGTLNALIHSALRGNLRLFIRFALSAGEIDADYLFRAFDGVFERYPNARIIVLGTDQTCEAMTFCWEYFDRTREYEHWHKFDKVYAKPITREIKPCQHLYVSGDHCMLCGKQLEFLSRARNHKVSI